MTGQPGSSPQLRDGGLTGLHAGKRGVKENGARHGKTAYVSICLASQ
jgi:hypothetical protein